MILDGMDLFKKVTSLSEEWCRPFGQGHTENDKKVQKLFGGKFLDFLTFLRVTQRAFLLEISDEVAHFGSHKVWLSLS